MIGTNVPQPDITLHLDMDGVIRVATLSQAFPHEDLDRWIGMPWFETVSGVGSDKVKRLVEDARWLRVTGFRQINQRFPSGREILVEYATIRMGERDGLIAIGRNLQAVAELQARLVEAQQSMERKYWQLREVETRYRHLFDNADEPVLLVRAANLRILEANPAAMRAMRALRAEGGEGRGVLGEVAAEDREAFQAMLARARAHGKSTGILVRLGAHRELWLVRASLMNSDTGDLFLLQLARAGTSGPVRHSEDRVPVEELIDRGPDAFVVTDGERTVLRSNRAFLELVRMSGAEPAVGSRIDRWLSPASALDALIAAVRREGRVRNHAASVRLASGDQVPVQISAVGSSDIDPHYFGLLLREAGP